MESDLVLSVNSIDRSQIFEAMSTSLRYLGIYVIEPPVQQINTAIAYYSMNSSTSTMLIEGLYSWSSQSLVWELLILEEIHRNDI